MSIGVKVLVVAWQSLGSWVLELSYLCGVAGGADVIMPCVAAGPVFWFCGGCGVTL